MLILLYQNDMYTQIVFWDLTHFRKKKISSSVWPVLISVRMTKKMLFFSIEKKYISVLLSLEKKMYFYNFEAIEIIAKRC